jgi:hypothetical protein
MRDLSFGYTNHLAAYQEPKSRVGNEQDHEARPGSRCLTYSQSSKYEWNQCLTQREKFEGCGEIDERPAWRCSDCGVELQDVLSSCCHRCGSVEPAVWR